MNEPLVTIVCVCFNQGNYVKRAVESALYQTHQAIQLIIVDDGSTDNSKMTIEGLVEKNPQIQFINHKKNIGYCKAFNSSLSFIKGEFIIDLAADDELMPHRVQQGLRSFALHGKNMGVHFSDAAYVNEQNEFLHLHSMRFPHHTVPQGNIYRDLIERYFICAPTMMFRKSVIDELNGYDETLSYEDFDFWIRSSKKNEYYYSTDTLVKKRIIKNSLGERQFNFRSKHQWSTYQVCKKILLLNSDEAEKLALDKRIQYEIKVNLRLLNFALSYKYLLLLLKNKK